MPIHQIKRLICVVCPNKFALHDKENPYIRYLIVVHEGGTTWIDDPDVATCTKIFQGAPSSVTASIIYSPCQWCQSKQPPPE